MRRVDLLVLGGGPAGAALASMAAGSGARVIVVERERFPRDKVCGEFLSAEGVSVLSRLGALQGLLSAGAAFMDSCRITDRRGHAIDAPLPNLPGAGREAMGISRFLLDEHLLSLARRKGALVREQCEAVAPLTENGRIVGARLRRVGARTAEEELRATVVAAADGRRSMLVRALHPRLGDPIRSHGRSWFGLKVHMDGDPRTLERRVELHLFKGGYVGLGTIEGGRINLCCMVTVEALRRCGGSPERVLRELIMKNTAVEAALARARPSSGWKSVGPLRFGIRKPAAGGALFVGDAAGTIDPFSGEGMTNALLAAEMALPFALDAAEEGGLTPALAQAYERRWKAAFAPITHRVRHLGRVFEHPWLSGTAVSLLAGVGRSWMPALVASTRTGPS